MFRALIAVLGLLALAVVAALVAVPILIQRNLSVEAVEARGSALAGRPVTVESVGITFRPTLRIRAEGVVVAGAGSVDVVEAEVAVLPLLRRRVEASELHLRGARLPVERGQDGGLRLRVLHPPGREGPEVREGRDDGGSFPALPALEARGGEIFLVESDGTPASAPVLKIVRLELAPLRAEGRTPVRVEVALAPGEGGRLGIDRMRLEGFLERVDGAVRVRDGRVEGDALLIGSLRFPRLEGRFDYAPGRVGVERLVLSGYDGTVSFEGSVSPARPGRMEGALRADGLDLSALTEDWRGRSLETPLGSLDLEGQVALFLREADRGTGQAAMAIRGGALPAGSLFGTLLGSIGRLTGRVISLGSRAAPAPSRVERISATWELRDDRLHTQDLEVVTDDYRYEGSGSLGLDQTIAFSGRLQLSNRGAQRMVASAALPLGDAGGLLPEIPLDVGGRLASPSFTAGISALPVAATSALANLVPGRGGLAKGAAEAGKGAAEVGKGAADLGKGAARAGKQTLDKVLGR